MSISYPVGLDSFIDPIGSDTLANPDHSQQHSDLNNAVEALETKLGINSSAVNTTHDFKLSDIATGAKALSNAILDTDVTLSADSDSKVATQKAVKSYADSVRSDLSKQVVGFDQGDQVLAFGDSITNGVGASDLYHQYAYLFGIKEGTLNNDASNGLTLSGMLAIMYGDISLITEKTKSFALIGYNDMRLYGTDATALTEFEEMLYAFIGFSTNPLSKKIIAQGDGVTYANAGNWSNTPLYGGVLGKYSSTQNETATMTISGTSIIVGMTKASTTTGTYTITIDGTLKGTYSATSESADALAIAHLFTGLSQGNHTVVVKVTSSGQSVYFDWAAGNGWMTDNFFPVMYIGNCLKMTTSGYALGSPFNNGSDEAVALHNSSISSVLTDMKDNFGANVFLVDADAVYDPNNDVGVDDIHPNDTGHQKIANAFIAADITEHSHTNVPLPFLNWVEVSTFKNSWVNYGAGYDTAGYTRDPSGRVFLKGVVKSGTDGQPVFTLPIGYRPTTVKWLVGNSNGGFGSVIIGTSGDVGITGTGSGTLFSLSGISFYP